jgi:hypothetical protein
VRRLTESVWAYASVCAGLHLRPLLSKLVDVLAARLLAVLATERARGDGEGGAGAAGPGPDAWHLPGESLAQLVGADVEALVGGPRGPPAHPHTTGKGPGAPPHALTLSSASAGYASETSSNADSALDWRGAAAAKGEVMQRVVSPCPRVVALLTHLSPTALPLSQVMLRVVFHVADRFGPLLAGDVWAQVRETSRVLALSFPVVSVSHTLSSPVLTPPTRSLPYRSFGSSPDCCCSRAGAGRSPPTSRP